MEDLDGKQKKPVAPGETPNTGRLLTGKQVFAITLVIVGAVATGVINVGVREYYQPDVRYEEGTWYYSGSSGMISLRIKNYGAADAERIVFTVSFDEAIRNASVSDPTIDCRFDDPKDPKTTTGRIDRLVPGQTAFVYFDVGRNFVGTVFKEGPFVRSVVYNGGIGRTGQPRLWKLLVGLVGGFVAGMAVSFAVNRLLLSGIRGMRREQQELRRRLLIQSRTLRTLEKRYGRDETNG